MGNWRLKPLYMYGFLHDYAVFFPLVFLFKRERGSSVGKRLSLF